METVLFPRAIYFYVFSAAGNVIRRSAILKLRQSTIKKFLASLIQTKHTHINMHEETLKSMKADYCEIRN